MINWAKVETVLLDMDGTLLDLHFDNHFWLTVVPQTISKQQQRPVDEVIKEITERYQQVAGQLEWYCLDYWQAELGLDIMALKRQHSGKIKWLKDVVPFLAALKSKGKKRILITNAHPLSLELKTLHTQLDQHLDQLHSTHEFGFAKEKAKLWQLLQKKCGYAAKSTLFIDDNEHLLQVAKQAGIGFQLGIFQPDSQQPGREMQGFKTIKSYQSLTQELQQSKRCQD